MKTGNIIKAVISLVLVVGFLALGIGLINKISDKANDAVDNILGVTTASTTAATTTTSATNATGTGTETTSAQACSHVYNDSGVCTKCGIICAHPASVSDEYGNMRCSTCNALTGLAAPVVSRIAYGLSWTAVPDTLKYIVSIDGVASAYFGANVLTYACPSSLTGSHTVTVRAEHGSVKSAESNIVVIGSGYIANGTITYGKLTQNNIVYSGETATITVTPNTDYLVPTTVAVTMGGAALTAGTDYTYNSTTGVISVPNVVANIAVTAACPYGKYYVTATVEGGTCSGTQIWIAHGQSATFAFTPGSDYLYPTSSGVSVFQNGVRTNNITYNPATGTLVVNNVTGTLSITGYCQLKAPVITLSGSNVEWQKNSGALGYRVYKNGEYWKYVTSLGCDLSQETGQFTISVKATSEAEFDGEGVNVSALSNTVTYTSDYTVTSAITPADAVGSVVGADLGAPGPVLYGSTASLILGCRTQDYRRPATITVTMGSTTLTAGTDYTYNSATGAISIPNVTGNLNITGVCELVTVDAPVITWLDGYRTVEWTAVTDAAKYYVYIDLNTPITVTDVLCDVQNYITTAGEHTVCVRAVTSDDYSSDASNTLTGTYYSVTYTLTNLTNSAANSSLAVAAGNINYDFFLTPDTGYNAPTSLAITVGGTALAFGDYSITSTDDGKVIVSIPSAKVTGNIAVSGTGGTLYNVTCTAYDSATYSAHPSQVNSGNSLVITGSCNSEGLAVVMGGIDIAADVFKLGDAITGTLSYAYVINIPSVTGEVVIYDYVPCFVKGTLITLADGSKKKIEDITYDDDLLVWNFDNGCSASAKALWISQESRYYEYEKITFASGRILKIVDGHRVFSKTQNSFVYASNAVGDTVVTENGEDAITSCQIISEYVDYYNIITYYHMNLYAEGVLTSCRYSNLYEFSSDMKYITVEREIKPFSEFDIPYEYYVGMRCGEQDISVADMNKYISRLVNSAKSK